jgi:hypothetical protein
MLTRVNKNNTLVQNILKLKGVPFTTEENTKLSLIFKELELSDLNTIIHYIDERYPIPQVISGDVENRARIREICSLLLHDPSHCDQLASTANPFVFGPAITLVDLIVFEHTSNTPFKQRIHKILGAVDPEGWE